jgi:hypothetical protein
VARGTGFSFHRERLVLGLIAAAALATINPLSTQDVTRLSLSLSIVHRQTFDVDPYHDLMLDRAYRAGHWYSDKPPGMSVAAIPAVEALRGVNAVRGGSDLHVWLRKGQLWLIRVLTSGVALLVLCLLVGRAAESLAAGTGAATAVTFGLGTIAGPLGPTMLAHVAAAALAFGGFLLAWRRPAWAAAAGAIAGTAVLFEYQAAIACVAIAAYAAAQRGLRGAAEFVAGALPAAGLLAAYDTLAFGSPFHFSYAYVANRFTALQHTGFYGIGVPDAHGARLAFVGSRGLLTLSPVLAAAAVGLLLLCRGRHRREAVACLAVAAAFAVLDCGYFDPYGGDAPGPRFVVVGLPFLALGLPEVLRRAPRAIVVLALASVALVTWGGLTWDGIVLPPVAPETIWSRLGAPRAVGLALVAVAAAAASALAYAPLVRKRS